MGKTEKPTKLVGYWVKGELPVIPASCQRPPLRETV